MSNILQWLAKAFHKNSEPKLFHKSIPTHFHDFKDLFTKSSFDHLPDRKVWDHAIELVPDAKASSCKVYPLAPNKQPKMDEYTLRSCPWPLLSSSLRRRMVPYALFRTIEP
jgi:hypothetical protein